MHVAVPSDPPLVPAAPPSVPESPSIPAAPAPVAPNGTPRTGGSGGSSNDASRGLQLLLFAVGTTMAAVVLTQRRHVFTLRSAIAPIGFVPSIERPG
jgi:hypothetical protein